jgi:multicomponent Na+:H+ antiporter subunit B
MVAAVLASYRGFDTLGETALILIAGISVLLILSRSSAQTAAK